jgi:5-methylcytosine-specific restriction enzyme A
MPAPTRRLLFARVGWMARYAGPSQTDPRPKRGGRYNEEGNVGNEAFNFKVLDGKFYGWFQSPAGNAVNLSRVDPTASGESLSGVRIVWVATRDDGGQAVVGWYDNATLYAGPREYPEGSGRGENRYKCVADNDDAVLLPDAERVWDVPKGKNGIGQANVFYPIGPDGCSRLDSADHRWMLGILDKIDAYAGLKDEKAAV